MSAGNARKRIDEPLADKIDDAAEVGAREPDDHPEEDREDGGTEANDHRRLRAVDDARVEVAPVRIRPEPVRGRRPGKTDRLVASLPHLGWILQLDIRVGLRFRRDLGVKRRVTREKIVFGS